MDSFQKQKRLDDMTKMTALRIALSLGFFSTSAMAEEEGKSEESAHQEAMEHHSEGPACVGFGPQAPRDIDALYGENNRFFSLAPHYADMNLCNIHFHTNAEHKAQDFSLYAGPGEHGHGGGYQCLASRQLTAAELKMPEDNHCQGVKPGDTVEVHWVYSSCDVEPGPGLGACLSSQCSNPNLRVESQVFMVVNDATAMNFADMTYGGLSPYGYHQARSLPDDTGAPVMFLGSTTGPKYSEQTCSPMQVTWSVRPHCAKIDINSLSRWCGKNVFHEDHAHGVRALVVNPKLLSTIE